MIIDWNNANQTYIILSTTFNWSGTLITAGLGVIIDAVIESLTAQRIVSSVTTERRIDFLTTQRTVSSVTTERKTDSLTSERTIEEI